MFKADAKEATPLCDRVLSYLLTMAPTKGLPGATLRTAIGDFLANTESLIQTDSAGPPLDNIFELARLTGIGMAALAAVRAKAVAETPISVGATLIQNALIEFTLATEARVLADTTFVSREDVDAVKDEMNQAFAPMEELAADEMAQASYMALIKLHASVSFHLAQTARPLPRMLQYEFYQSYPSLVVTQKLYADPSRADELRSENKIVHPAFCPMQGRALSS